MPDTNTALENTYVYDIFAPEKLLRCFFMGEMTTKESLYRIVETFYAISEYFDLLRFF